MKREIPVEVALIYNTSYTKYFSYVNIIHMKEEHLQGFRTGLTRSLKYADASGMLDKLNLIFQG
jgi:DNA gyrase/topoisomerase IV subunit B